MNTNFLKRFATEARSRLRAGVATKIKSLGFDADGNAVPGMEPTPMVGGCTWNGQILPSAFAEQWEALRRRLKAKGLKEVVEEGAYTWFNRLMAIRILSMNGIAEPVLRFVDEARTPKIVDDARQGRVIPMPDQQLQRLRKLFDDPTRINEQFALLVTEFCHQTPILQACFGSLADYTELLLPNNILDKGGFIEMLNTADFITEDDYKSAELIGWLYQFYISDRKDEVFAKKGKVEADEIPAATQIFTPNWIVKYMVQNAVLPQVRSNRLPEEDKTYLIDKEAPEEPKKPKDLKVADLACGSGHILNECFDLLYDLYIASGFGRGEAIESIFANNLLGIDIDERARQLATFALMLKACQRDESFADAHVLPRVYSVPSWQHIRYGEEVISKKEEVIKGAEEFMRLSDITGEAADELREAFALMSDADSLGSIMKFDISGSTREVIRQTVEYWNNKKDELSSLLLIPYYLGCKLILSLTDHYDAIVMNPPYMPTSRVDVLKSYATKNYPDSKTDLFSVFMDVCIDRLKDGGKYGMINMQSWMFLSSFETLRKKILDTQHIDSLLHLGPRTFDELSGEVVQNAAFVISKGFLPTTGFYYRLIDGRSCDSKRDMFLSNDNVYTIENQKRFEKIPGNVLGYWISDSFFAIVQSQKSKTWLKARHGILTGNDDKYLRYWFEPSINNVCLNAQTFSDIASKNEAFFPMNKGGARRKWYGNNNIVIWIKNNLDNFNNNKLAERELFFREGITWTEIADIATFRFSKLGILFGHKGATAFFDCKEDLYMYLGYANSNIFNIIKHLLFTGLSFTAGNLQDAPFIHVSYDSIIQLVQDCISIAKQDWDAHESSWDFKVNPLISEVRSLPKETSVFNDKREADFEILFPDLVRCDANLSGRMDSKVLKPTSIEDCFISFRKRWTELFRQLHQNEESINEEFINIYGLQGELDSRVDLRDITILQQGEISIDADDVDGAVLIWNNDVVIKQLISYMVGVWMGRYRLDRPGLNVAHPNPTDEEMASYQYGPDNATLVIDDDAIIPILPTGAPFEDNLTEYIANFVRIAWGEESQTDNLNFIERCLGKKIEDYVQKDFWKDHKKMYQNRPIYWLFSSKKGAFKALVYVHRMHPYTVEQVRTRYLLKYMDWLRSEAQRLEIRDADLTTAERRRLDRLRSDIEECEEYHERLQVVAEQAIPIDLDNGIPANHALFGDILTKLK